MKITLIVERTEYPERREQNTGLSRQCSVISRRHPLFAAGQKTPGELEDAASPGMYSHCFLYCSSVSFGKNCSIISGDTGAVILLTTTSVTKLTMIAGSAA